jgi:hypothetical protein
VLYQNKCRREVIKCRSDFKLALFNNGSVVARVFPNHRV